MPDPIKIEFSAGELDTVHLRAHQAAMEKLAEHPELKKKVWQLYGYIVQADGSGEAEVVFKKE